MGAPFNDIGLNPPRNTVKQTTSGVATVATIKNHMVVLFDTATTNFRDVKIATAAGATGVAGIAYDPGDPNNTNLFAIGDEFTVVTDGTVEVWLIAGGTATKGEPCITAATGGAVKAVASETPPYDIIGTFAETYNNSGGSNNVLVSVNVRPYRRFS